MKIKSVSFHKTYNLGNYCSEKIGVEIDLDDEDGLGEQDVLNIAREIVERNHKEQNKGLYYDTVTQPSTVPLEERTIRNHYTKAEIPFIKYGTPPNHSDNEIEAMEEEKPFHLVEAIMSCEDAATLKIYKFLHKQSPEATEAYNQKLNELTK